jgi:hypothetical protein
VGVDDAIQRAGVRHVRAVEAVHDEDDLYQCVIGFDGGGGWTVAYQDNGYPEQAANSLAASHDAAKAVIVYWNVNARTEFSYWEAGERVVSFQTPDKRYGADPDRLLPQMVDTVGLSHPYESGAPTSHYYARMLSLADRLTGCHLNSDFLDRPVVIGELDEDDRPA